MTKRNYNPLNEGYTGGNRGSERSDASASQAPSTFPKIQSAVVTSSKPQPISSDTLQSNKK